MPSGETLHKVADRVATVTLNRPDKLNAWTAVMERDVCAAIEEAERDGNVRVIVMTCAGRGFCAGADAFVLSTIAEQDLNEKCRTQALQSADGEREGGRPNFRRKYSYFPAICKPMIALINGPVVGLGLVITLYCDLRFASYAVRFGTALARRGLIAEYGNGMDAAALFGSSQCARSACFPRG
jgi:enoyl-CoA hydratase/carnithine racemase